MHALALFCLVLYHYAGKVEAVQCYSCSGSCDDPEKVEDCSPASSDWLCWAVEGTSGNKTGVTKGCIPNTDETLNTCDNYNNQDGLSCYTCDTDLCNDEIDNGGVTKCYTCKGDCSKLTVEECPDIRGTEYACMSYKFVNEDDTISIEKGCVPKVSAITDLCENVQEKGSNCYTCDSDLCNEKNELGKKCYFCEDTCDDPLQIEECPLGYAEDYGCMSYQFEEDGVTITQKKCVPKVPVVTDLCANAEENGGTCYICDRSLCNEEDDPDS